LFKFFRNAKRAAIYFFVKQKCKLGLLFSFQESQTWGFGKYEGKVGASFPSNHQDMRSGPNDRLLSSE
jgi:hypothetical protein